MYDKDEMAKKSNAETNQATPSKSMGMLGGQCVSRQSAKAAIQDRIFRLRQEAQRLDSLLDALPSVLPTDADEALWFLIHAK